MESADRDTSRDGDGLKTFHLQLPATPEDIAKLELGAAVYLSGVIYTAREGVYKRVLEDGVPVPVDLRTVSNANFHCSPAAAPDGKGGYNVGAVTATASFRFSKWMKRWLELSGCKLVIGKGGMPVEDYRDVLVPMGAVYLTTVGYGTGALLGRAITRVQDVFWLDDLGVAQAMWMLEVKDFGPLLVESDLAGNSLFAQPPALHRYGETADRKRELM